jgi:hypothetical protein
MDATPPEAAFPNYRVVMMMEQGWSALYMSTQLARVGLLAAVIVQKEPLDGVAWNRVDSAGFRIG